MHENSLPNNDRDDFGAVPTSVIDKIFFPSPQEIWKVADAQRPYRHGGKLF